MKKNASWTMAPILLLGLPVTSYGINAVTQNHQDKPNIVIIFTDDQGYGDVSYHSIHAPGVSTPGIDQIAQDGLIFTNGYVTGYVCAPSRVGLLTGRYQQRSGFYRAPDSRQGMSLDEITIAELLKKEGYSTAVFGKWHVGLQEPYRPLQRGFDTFYGFLGHGAHDYFDLKCDYDDPETCMYRDADIINDTGYLTDNLGREAIQFIENNASEGNPFFIYLAFNAVHWPLQAPEMDVRKFSHEDPERNIYLAMLYRMDLAIEQVVKSLKENGVYENTIIFFMSDNGGATRVHADNRPLRDHKHSTYEGGIRVPFVISWPEKLSHNTIEEPVIALDVLPTVCDILNIDLPDDREYDGRSLLPLITGNQVGPVHDYLFWDGDENRWAVRNGPWKAVKCRPGNIELYKLDQDISETNDLSKQHPDIRNHLINKYQEWRAEMGEPMAR